MIKNLNEYLKTVIFVFILLEIVPPIFKNIKKQITEHREPKNKVGVVSIKTPITGSKKIIKELQKFFKDTSIKAIILQLDSPGGAAGTSQAIANEIRLLKETHLKPIISYSENMCASGAYYIAAATDYIVTNQATIIGSIGSRLSTQFKLKKLLEKYNIETETIHSGEYKTILDPFTPTSAAQTELLQTLSNNVYEQFAKDISIFRKLSLKQIKIWGEGKIFTGVQAKELGLIDELGNITNAINYLKQNIVPSGVEIELIESPKISLWQRILSKNPEDDDFEYSTSLCNNFFQGLINFIENKNSQF